MLACVISTYLYTKENDDIQKLNNTIDFFIGYSITQYSGIAYGGGAIDT